jgi:uncharacterized pyridoxal phosphate-containing UPF0001 family protein
VTALQTVLGRVARVAAAPRPTKLPVRLVAVSKTKPMSAIMELYDAGHRHFGENYVCRREKFISLGRRISILRHFLSAFL